jgi:hypothetical protein
MKPPDLRGRSFGEAQGCANIIVGIALCFAGLIPGLLYFILLSAWYPRCAACKNKGGLVPTDSAVGREMAARVDSRATEEAVTPPTVAPIETAEKDERERLQGMTTAELNAYTDQKRKS